MITAVYILRNSEKTIINSLNSIKDKVDEIICIVDTRSNVETFNLCHYYGHKNIKAFYYEWQTQNYSDARNYGISKATGDWILTIDGDETLESIGEINNIADCYECKIVNKLNGQDHEHLSVRLFKNNKDIIYEGETHESVELSLNRMSAKKGIMDLRIRHTGYDNMTSEQWRSKIDKLFESYIEQLKNEPNNPRVFYNLTTYYWGIKEYQSCIDYGVLSLFKALIPECKAQICLMIYFCYKKLDKKEIGIFWLQMSNDIYPSQSATTQLINFYESINDKDSVINELTNLKQLTITGSRFPNDININTESVERKLKEAQSVLQS